MKKTLSKRIVIRPKKMAITALKHSETLYERDFCEWAFEQSKLIRKGDFDRVDMENLAEEIEALGRSERSAIRSLILVWLQHTLKKEFMPEKQGNSLSWDMTLYNSRRDLKQRLKECPSLKKYAMQCVSDEFDDAKEMAAFECEVRIKDDRFPRKCPWTLADILN